MDVRRRATMPSSSNRFRCMKARFELACWRDLVASRSTCDQRRRTARPYGETPSAGKACKPAKQSPGFCRLRAVGPASVLARRKALRAGTRPDSRCYTGLVKLRHFRAPAWLALFAILFAQLATAAYACPLLQKTPDIPVTGAQMETPCPGMDTSTPDPASALCVEHCKAGCQLVDNHVPIDVPAITRDVLFIVDTLFVTADVSTRSTEPSVVHAAAPPIYASSSRLRI